MISDDRDGVKRISISIIGALIVIGAVLFTLYHINADNQKTNRERIEACKTIRDEQYRDDCLTGGYYYGQGGR